MYIRLLKDKQRLKFDEIIMIGKLYGLDYYI